MPDTSFKELRALLSAGHNHLTEMLDSMSPALQQETAGIARVRQFPAGEVLLRDGEDSREIGYIIDGALAMTKLLADEREHVIGVLVPTDMYGRLFDGPSGYQVEALTDARVLTLERAPFEAILRREPTLERLFFVSVMDELDAAREWVLMLNGRRVIEKVAAFLLFLLRRQLEHGKGKGPMPQTVKVPMDRANFARCIAIRPETLSRALHDLAGEGMIRLKNVNEFEILDLPRLVDLAAHDVTTAVEAAGRDRTS